MTQDNKRNSIEELVERLMPRPMAHPSKQNRTTAIYGVR